jgi:hypothetical protein
MRPAPAWTIGITGDHQLRHKIFDVALRKHAEPKSSVGQTKIITLLKQLITHIHIVSRLTYRPCSPHPDLSMNNSNRHQPHRTIKWMNENVRGNV